MRDETSFWLALPGMGAFRTNREAGTKRIRRLLARAPYQEMLLVKLETRTFTDSCFTAQWHVRDFVGGGDGDCVETSVGALVRLRTTPSDNIHPQ